MKKALWTAQILLAAMFLFAGGMKLFAFDKMVAADPTAASQHGLYTFVGVAEFAGALGMILPILTGVYPILTAWAAAGLAMIMLLAMAFHLSRHETSHLPPVIILFLLAAFVTWGRGLRRGAVAAT